MEQPLAVVLQIQLPEVLDSIGAARVVPESVLKAYQNSAQCRQEHVEDAPGALVRLEKWLSRPLEKEPGQAENVYRLALAERGFEVGHRSRSSGLINSFRFIGKDTGISFLHFSDQPAVRFARHEGGGSILLVWPVIVGRHGVVAGMTPKDRAASVVRSVVLPEMTPFDQAFRGSGIEFYALGLFFGCHPFTSGAEGLVFVVSAADCRRFADATITDDDLLSRAAIYLIGAGPALTKATLKSQ